VYDSILLKQLLETAVSGTSWW